MCKVKIEKCIMSVTIQPHDAPIVIQTDRFLAHLDEVQEDLLYYPSIGVGVGGGVGVSKKFKVKVLYVMGKALSGELSCPCDRSCSVHTSHLSTFFFSDIPCYLQHLILNIGLFKMYNFGILKSSI